MLCWAWGPAVCWHVQGQSPQQAGMRDAVPGEMELLLTSVLPPFLPESQARAVSRPWRCRGFPVSRPPEQRPHPVPWATGGERAQVSGGVSPGHLAGSPAAGCQGQEGVPTLGASPEGGRKEVMQDRISPSQGCNLPPCPNHPISKLLY